MCLVLSARQEVRVFEQKAANSLKKLKSSCSRFWPLEPWGSGPWGRSGAWARPRPALASDLALALGFSLAQTRGAAQALGQAKGVSQDSQNTQNH